LGAVRVVERDVVGAGAEPAPPAPLARVSPARTEHTGQAPGPEPARTFWAMAICCSRLA
jgi:hypothetical protein